MAITETEILLIKVNEQITRLTSANSIMMIWEINEEILFKKTST